MSKDAALELPATPSEDPRCPPAGSGSLASGARLRMVGTGGDFTIDLPRVNWTANAAGTRYLYRDGSGATCQAIVLIAGRLMKTSRALLTAPLAVPGTGHGPALSLSPSDLNALIAYLRSL